MVLVAPPARAVLCLGRGQCSLPKAAPYPASSDWLMGPSQTQSSHFSVGRHVASPSAHPCPPQRALPNKPQISKKRSPWQCLLAIMAFLNQLPGECHLQGSESPQTRIVLSALCPLLEPGTGVRH